MSRIDYQELQKIKSDIQRGVVQVETTFADIETTLYLLNSTENGKNSKREIRKIPVALLQDKEKKTQTILKFYDGEFQHLDSDDNVLHISQKDKKKLLTNIKTEPTEILLGHYSYNELSPISIKEYFQHHDLAILPNQGRFNLRERVNNAIEYQNQKNIEFEKVQYQQSRENKFKKLLEDFDMNKDKMTYHATVIALNNTDVDPDDLRHVWTSINFEGGEIHSSALRHSKTNYINYLLNPIKYPQVRIENKKVKKLKEELKSLGVKSIFYQDFTPDDALKFYNDLQKPEFRKVVKQQRQVSLTNNSIINNLNTKMKFQENNIEFPNNWRKKDDVYILDYSIDGEQGGSIQIKEGYLKEAFDLTDTLEDDFEFAIVAHVLDQDGNTSDGIFLETKEMPDSLFAQIRSIEDLDERVDLFFKLCDDYIKYRTQPEITRTADILRHSKKRQP